MLQHTQGFDLLNVLRVFQDTFWIFPPLFSQTSLVLLCFISFFFVADNGPLLIIKHYTVDVSFVLLTF